MNITVFGKGNMGKAIGANFEKAGNQVNYALIRKSSCFRKTIKRSKFLMTIGKVQILNFQC